jgi:hypothetical protein
MLYIRNLNTTKNLKIGIRKDQNRISSILVSLGGEGERLFAGKKSFGEALYI